MKTLFSILFFCLTFPVVVGAQVGFQPQNDLTISPAYPEPGQTFTVRVEDYAGGLFGAQISWLYNGEAVPDSLNQRSVTLEAPAIGTTATVEATFLTPAGAQERLTKTIRPVYVDVIIEPQTRTPQWYLGRSLPSVGSQVTATAIVNDGSFLDTQTLIYSWSVNSTVLSGGPQRGQHTTAFTVPRGNSMIVSVSVSTAGGQILASRATEIPIVEPTLLFYERHSLYGAQILPITTPYNLIGDVVTIQAEPFHLDTRVYNNPDVAEWELNRIATNNGLPNPYQITLEPAGTGGQTQVDFHVRSLETLTQGAAADLAINFN